MESNYLVHYGVLGMKWGVRKDEVDRSKYSLEQERRDKRVYGKSASKRIAKNISKGDSVQGARSREASRINSARKRGKVLGTVGLFAGGIGGALLGRAVSNTAVSALSEKIPSIGQDPVLTKMALTAVAVGSGKVGSLLGRYGGQSIGMISGGYNPSKYRDAY